LHIFQNIEGEVSSNVATAYATIGHYLMEKGMYKNGEINLLIALQIREKLFGKESIDYALSLESLASLYSREGRIYDADKLHIEAFEILRATVGENHRLTEKLKAYVKKIITIS
jgi:hypothetical protein